MIPTLPSWEQELLHGIEFHYDEEDMHNILKRNANLYFVSNSGEAEGLDYYKWVTTTSMETLCTQKGHTKGNPNLMESL
eukprot:15344348-Ditylum_brightwellii.AAC.1